MKIKTIVSVLLLAFVAVSVAFAFRKLAPSTSATQKADSMSIDAEIAATPVGLDAKLAETQFTAGQPHLKRLLRGSLEDSFRPRLLVSVSCGYFPWRCPGLGC